MHTEQMNEPREGLGEIDQEIGRVPSGTCGVQIADHDERDSSSFAHVRDTGIRQLASKPSFDLTLSLTTTNTEPLQTKSILLSQKSSEGAPSEGDNLRHPFPIVVACRSNSTHSSTPTSPADDASPLQRGSIRFLPRVRITSGLRGTNGHRSVSASPTIPAVKSPIITGQQPPSPSLASTRSSSVSSSISAPIRFREQEPVPSKWGPLGRRVNMFASQKRKRRSLNAVKSAWDSYATPSDVGANPSGERGFDETTPLLIGQDVQVDQEEAAFDINREIDAIFGRWPGRLLNRHWWWWQVEPFVCCWCCADDHALFDY